MWSWAHYVEFYKLVCFSVNLSRAHGGMSSSHGVYGNILQLAPICVIVIALCVMHVLSHNAMSIGGVVVSTQCILRQMSDCGAHSVTKCELRSTSSSERDHSQ